MRTVWLLFMVVHQLPRLLLATSIESIWTQVLVKRAFVSGARLDRGRYRMDNAARQPLGAPNEVTASR